jgi:hypothetical protein
MNGKRPRFCHLCGHPLTGRFALYGNGLVVCATCWQTCPRCERCSIPARHLQERGGARLCERCYHEVQLCACCGRALLAGPYFQSDSQPNVRYCVQCVQQRPRCDLCQAPVNERGRVLPGRDGQSYRCASCFAEAVESLDTARALYRATWEGLRREPGLNIPLLPELHIGERALLRSLQSRSEPVLPGHTTEQQPVDHALGIFVREGEHWDIYIEHYLPRNLFQAIAAHELAHAWQELQGLSGQALLIREGFAEWVAYRYLLLLGEEQLAARLMRQPGLYGEGLRYFVALENEQGREALFRATLSCPSAGMS